MSDKDKTKEKTKVQMIDGKLVATDSRVAALAVVLQHGSYEEQAQKLIEEFG